jgi:hypothetical protein
MSAKKESATGAFAALLAAIFPEVRRQVAKRFVVGGVIVERAFAPRLHDAGIDEAFEVMAERRGRHVDMRLNRACGRAVRPRLHDEPKNRQAHGVPQCAQLLGMMLQFRGHALLLDHSK